jgi:zinc transporter 1
LQYTQYVDPSLSIVIVIIIVTSTVPLLKESSLVLMQTVPDNFEVTPESLKKF